MRFWILMSLLLSPVFGNAQTFQQLSSVNDNPITNVKALIQDDLGYMWFATADAVLRYDGHTAISLKQLTKDSLDLYPSLVNNMVKDDLGFIWLVGVNNLVFKLNPNDFSTENFSDKLPQSVSGKNIWSFTYNSSQLFIGTAAGLVVMDIKSKEFKHIYPSEYVEARSDYDINEIYHLIVDNDNEGLVWLFTRGGLMSCLVDQNIFTFHKQEEDRMKNYTTTALWHGLQDEEGNIWTGGNIYGLSIFDITTATWSYLEDEVYFPHSDRINKIDKVKCIKDDKVWILTADKGMGYYDLKKSNYLYFHNEPGNPYTLQASRYSDFFIDDLNNYWVSGEKGVSYFNPDFQMVNNVKLPVRESLKMDVEIHTISWEQIDDKNVLVGSMLGDGLYKLNMLTNEIDLVDGFVYSRNPSKVVRRKNNIVTPIIVQQILTTQNGEVYVSLYDGFYLYDQKQNVLRESTSKFAKEMFNRRLGRVRIAEDNSLWILLNNRSIIHVEGKNNSISSTILLDDLLKKDSIAKDIWINDFDIDGDLVYIRTNKEILKYSDKNKVLLDFKPFKGEDLHLIDVGEGQMVYAQNHLYLTNINFGLIELNLSNYDDLNIYDLDSGLSSSSVHSVIKDKLGKIWVGSSNGLSTLDTSTKKLINLGRKHGIREPNMLHFWNPWMEFSKQGNIFYYSPDYVSWIKQSSFNNSKLVLKASITSIDFIDDVSKNVYRSGESQEVNITYQDNYFNINFSSGDYTLPGNQKFSYKLEGFDDQWRTTESSVAKYTKVPPGDYTIRVKAFDFLGNPSENIAELNINIKPPYWETWWFYLLLCLVFLGLLYCFYAFWRKQIKEKEKIKSDFQKRVTEIEMDALRAQMNPHFLFNSLNSIKNYALTKGPFETAEYLTKFSHLIRLILQNSKTSTIVLQDEIEALRLYIEIEDLRFEEKFDFEINIDEGINLLTWHIPPLILQPYVENAIWHGLMHKQSGKGKLLVELKNIGNALICIIEDNGIGREMAQKIKERKNNIRKKSLGMKITRDRIELTNELYNTDTSVKIVDLINKAGESIGTRVIITIPILGGEEYSSTE